MSNEYKLPSFMVILSTSDLYGNITSYNNGFRDASGYRDEELMGKPHNMLRHPDMPKAVFADLWNTLTAGKPWFGVIKNKRKNGDYYWVAANTVPTIKNGTIIGYLSVRYPATEEQILSATKLYQSIQLGHKKFSTTVPKRHYHQVMATLSFIASSSVLGLLFTDTLSSPIALSISGFIGFGSICYLTATSLLKNHISVPQKKAIEALCNAQYEQPFSDKSDLGFQLNLIRTHLAENMAKNYDFLRETQIMITAINSASTSIMIADNDFNIISINENLQKLFAQKEEKFKTLIPSFCASSIVGSNMDIFHKYPARQREILKSLDTLLQAEIKIADMVLLLTITPIVKENLKIGYVVEWLDKTIEATVVTELAQVFDGIIRGDFTKNIHSNAEGIYSKIKKDVNDSVVVIKRLFEQLETVMQDLSEAKTIAEKASNAKSHFIHNMTHELRTPLNAIIGFVQLLEMESNLTDNQKESLQQVMSASKHLLDIINQVLDMSKIEAGKLELECIDFDLNQVISSCVKMIMVSASQKGLSFSQETDSFFLPTIIKGDPLRLRQVLINLLNNAVKFTKKGSVALSIIKQDETLVFEIQDTGIGISEEVQVRLFQAFSQADEGTARQYGGTGLGLILSKELIEQMGGEITLTSKLGLGTKVSFSLPLQLSQLGELLVVSGKLDPISNAPAHNSLLSHKRVLLVEDNKINQLVATRLLEKIGVVPDLAHHGQEALEMRERQHYDLILLDIQMPVKDGYTTIIEIREEEKHTNQHQVVIGLSANGLQQDVDKAKSLGMDDYLTKPIDFNLLKEKISYYLHNNQAN